MTELNIAVAELVRFCHRSGDIDHRFTPSPTGVQGIAGHQRVRAQRPASYLSEFAVQYQHHEPGLQLTLRGRADGYDPEQGLVEEIKTCRIAPTAIPDAVAQSHLAQGLLYAAIIAAQRRLWRELRLAVAGDARDVRGVRKLRWDDRAGSPALVAARSAWSTPGRHRLCQGGPAGAGETDGL